MPRRVQAAEDAVAAVRRVAAERNGAVFVGIDGLGGAGKSTLADRVAAVVDGAVVVSIDDFQGIGIPEWDWNRLRRDVVEPLRAGRPAHYARQRWGDADPSGWSCVPAGAVVVIEGVSVTRVEAGVPWDLSLWVDTPQAVRHRRTLERDGPGLQSVWQDSWWPSEEAYAARERPWERVDVVVDGTA